MTEVGESETNDKVFSFPENTSSRNQMKFSLCELFEDVNRKKKYEDTISLLST